MKKIQVSTVKQTADVEVIYVNSNLIAKAIKSLIALKELDEQIVHESLRKESLPCIDEEGRPITDEATGTVKTMTEEHYDTIGIGGHALKAIHEIVMPFVKELTDAFEEE